MTRNEPVTVKRETAHMKEVDGEIICGDCREPVSREASTCPHCQAKLIPLTGPYLIYALPLGGFGLFMLYLTVTGQVSVYGYFWVVVMGLLTYLCIRPAIKHQPEETA